MTLPASGPISLAQIAGEFGLAINSVFPTAFYGKGGAPASGPLGFADFYGRTGAAPISASDYFPTAVGFSQVAQSTITATGGKTIASIVLVSGTADARINPGASGGTSTVGSVTTASSGTGVVSATYRYTTNTGEFVDVAYYGEWGT